MDVNGIVDIERNVIERRAEPRERIQILAIRRNTANVKQQIVFIDESRCGMRNGIVTDSAV